jgi:hypothetical protein
MRYPLSRGFACASEETQPRCGVTLDGVKRRKHTLVPRVRPAPDGRKEGGSQPTDSSRINRRLFLAPPLPMYGGQKHHDDLKKSCSQLLTLEVIADARRQARREAGAQRTLYAVACKRFIGIESCFQ